LVKTLGGEAQKLTGEVREAVQENGEVIGRKIHTEGRSPPGLNKEVGGVQGTGREEGYTGGKEGVVEAEREVERTLEGRLV